MKKTTLLGSLAGLLLMPALLAWAAGPMAPEAQGYTEGGPKLCLSCHDDAKVAEILHMPHAVTGDRRTPFAQHGCESCHGPADDHAQNRFKPPPVVMQKGPQQSPVAVRNAPCMSCHQGGLRMNWPGTQHANHNIACNDCHTIHVRKDPILVKVTQAVKCFTCHPDRCADSYKFSHHPVHKGLVVCTDCHAPMGSPGPRLLKEVMVNEVCYNCHAEKRGPFLYDHAAVRENCLPCHNPHGSLQAKLLIQRAPYLCQECHDNNTHAATPYGAGALPGKTYTPSVGTAAGLAQMGSRYQLMLRGCVNCHSEIHGSNSPGGMFKQR